MPYFVVRQDGGLRQRIALLQYVKALDDMKHTGVEDDDVQEQHTQQEEEEPSIVTFADTISNPPTNKQ